MLRYNQMNDKGRVQTLVGISNTLFFISLIVLMLGVLISGVGPQGFFPRKSDKVPGAYETPRKQTIVDRQDKALDRLKRSKIIWAGLIGIVISIVLAQF